VRLKTQEYDLTAPDQGDIYGLLKYLALVSPMRGKASPAPEETASYQVILTANAERLASQGWGQDGEGARVLTTKDWTDEHE
jgi:hypothetical protein